MHIVVDAVPGDCFEPEQQRLWERVSSAPGITEVKAITGHPRGGYSVTAERTGDTLDEIAAHLQSFGYRLVI